MELPPPACHTLAFSDEFDQPSIDSTRWNVIIDGQGGGNQECQYYTADSVNTLPDPASPTGYKGLALTISPIVNPQATNVHELANFVSVDVGASHPTQRFYKSGKVTTQRHFSFQYGRMDVRAKLPAGSHAWPAIWMLPERQTGGTEATTWPNLGEIDIMEQFGIDRRANGGGTSVGAALHWGSSDTHRTCVSRSTRLLAGEFCDAFHVFSIVWQPSKIEWYVDGVRYASMDPSSRGEHGPDCEPRPPWPFGTETREQLSAVGSEDKRNPFYLILNAAIGGTCGGLDVPPLDRPGQLSLEERATAVNYVTRPPQVLLVDYVRVYQRRLAGQDGPYLSITGPPTEPLPRDGAGNRSYHGTGDESVTASSFPDVVPATGTSSLVVDYNNDTASRYLHVDLLRVVGDEWTNVAYARSDLLTAGTGRVELSLTTAGLPAAGQYLWSVWTVSEVDEAAERPWDYKHSWQMYEAHVDQQSANE